MSTVNNANSGNNSPSQKTAAARKRRRWPLVAASVLIFLVLLVLALPSLLCTGPGVAFITSEINGRIQGKVAINRLSLGWFSPTTIHGLSVRDPAGNVVLSGVNLTTGLSLLHLATNWQNLGTVKLTIGKAALQQQAGTPGGLNLALAFASRGASAAATTPAAPASGNSSTVAPSGAASQLPPIQLKFEGNIGKLTFRSPTAPAVEADQTHISLALNLQKAGAPVTFALTTKTGLLNKPGAVITASGKLELFSHRRIRPLASISGQTNISVSNLDIAALRPVLSAEGIKLKPAGTMKFKLAYASLRGLAGDLKGTLTVRHCVLAGAMLKGDTARLGTVAVPLDVTWTQSAFHIQNVGVSCAMGDATVTGSGKLAAFIPAMAKGNNGGEANINIKAAAHLATVLQQLRNICQIPANIRVAGGQATAGINIVINSVAAKSPGQLPAASGTLQLKVAPLTLAAAGHKRSHVISADAAIGFDTMGKPLTANIGLSVAHGKGIPATLSLKANLYAIQNRTLLPAADMSGTLAVRARQFAYFREILERLNAPLTMDGVMHGNILATIRKGGNGTAQGKFVINGLALGGAALRGDHPQLGTCTIAIDGALTNQNINLKSFSIKTAAIALKAYGSTSLPDIQAIAKGKADWGHTQVHTRLLINAPLLATNLPSTLKLNGRGLRLKTGTISFATDLMSDGGKRNSLFNANLMIRDMAGRLKDRTFTIAPVTLTAAAERKGGQWDADRLTFVQTGANKSGPFAIQVHRVRGHRDWFNAEIALNLGALNKEADSMIQLSGLSARGQLRLGVQVEHAFSSTIAYRTNLNMDQFYLRPNAAANAITEQSLAFQSSGTVQRAASGVKAATAAWQISSPQITLMGNLHAQRSAADGWEVPNATVAIKDASLAGLLKIGQAVSPALGQYAISGNLGGTHMAVSWTKGTLEVPTCRIAAANLAVAQLKGGSNTSTFRESSLSLTTQAEVLTGKTTELRIKSLAITTADKLADVTIAKPMTVKLAAGEMPTIECPGVKLSADLAKLKPLLIALGRLSANRTLSGKVSVASSLQTAGKKLTMTLQARATGYQLGTAGSAQNLPPTNIAANLAGVADMSSDTFTATKTCSVAETADSGTGGDRVVLDSGNVVCWTDKEPENVRLTVHYDLTRLHALLAPFLPAGLKMSGTHSMVLAITGKLTNENSLQKLRNLTIAPTSLKFEGISIDGLALGPGSVGFSEKAGILALAPSVIPANKGTLNLGGQVDLNQAVPVYTASNVQLASGVNINAPMGGTLLKFLPIAWGGGANGTGLMTLNGQLNLKMISASIPLQYAALQKVGTFDGTISIIHLSSNSPLLGMISNLVKPLGMFGNGSMKMADSGIRPTEFHLKNGKVYYQHMKMVLTSFGLDFSGWVGLNNEVNQDVGITGAGLTVPIPLAITGTTQNPKLKLSGKPLQNIGKNLGNVIKKSGGNILNNLFGH